MTADRMIEPCMICDDLLWDVLRASRTCVARSRKANSSAATAMPTGLLRPSSAIAMPGEPERRWGTARRSVELRIAEQRPACRPGRRRPPLISIVLMIIAFGLTPAARAAAGFDAGRPQVEAEAGAPDEPRSSRRRAGSRPTRKPLSCVPAGRWKPNSLEEAVERRDERPGRQQLRLGRRGRRLVLRGRSS